MYKLTLLNVVRLDVPVPPPCVYVNEMKGHDVRLQEYL